MSEYIQPTIDRKEYALSRLKELQASFDPFLQQLLLQETERARDMRPEIEGFFKVAAEFVLRGGKRLRPAFVFEGFRTIAENHGIEAYYAASAIELLHAAALVHDDIIDNSDTRRRKPTVHKVIEDMYKDGELGKSLAIIVGDSLLAMANIQMSRIPLDNKGRIKARALFDQLGIEINNGQYLDILGNMRGEVDEDWVLKVMEFKTARYTVEKPLLIGASLAEADDQVLDALSRFAIPLGMAFQLQDDILGMFGTEERVGKPVDSDLKEGKQTLLIVRTLQALRLSGRNVTLSSFRRILGNPNLTQEEYQWAQNMIVETGALEACKNTATSLIAESVGVLDNVSIREEAKDYLKGIAEFIGKRDY